jgi:xanthine dehydrogenase small subunit
MRNQVLLYVNGTRHLIGGDAVFQPLTDFLRYELCKTGTKVVCAEGDCGACTVLIGRPSEATADFKYQAVNGCIQYLYQLDCTHIVTIEGVRTGQDLNPAQQAMMACHGAQCGYCTPGMVVAMSQYFFEKKETGKLEPATQQEIRNALTGNLCRCTGYEAILDAGCSVNPNQFASLSQLYPPAEMLADFQTMRQGPVQVQTEDRLVYLPDTLAEALKFKADYPKATVLSGGTDLHVVCNKRFLEPPTILSLSHITELEDITVENNILHIGGRASLAKLEAFVSQSIPEFSQILHVFGSPQIKQAGTLAGNIANGSPIADTLPFLFVMEAELELSSMQGSRRVNINQFYTGYKTTVMQPDELITAIHIPLPDPNEHLKLYKVSKRTHLDISTFTAAIRMTCTQNTIERASISYGGVGPTVLRLPKTEQFLQGKTFELSTFDQAGSLAVSEITPLSDVRGSSNYRYQLGRNILLKFFHETASTEQEIFA